MRQILVACEEANKSASLLRRLVTNCSTQRRLRFLERIQHAPQRHRRFNFKRDLVTARDLRMPQQRCRKFHTNPTHASVCTSTDSTGGRCSVMVVQSSPPFGEQ